MSRFTRILLLVIVLGFSLACSLISNPINDVKNTAATAQAAATDILALASAIPVETLNALPTTLSQFGNYFDPQGTPVAEWNGIPIMSQATAGQEFDTSNYSFKFEGTVKDATDFYSGSLEGLGWTTTLTMPGDENGGLLVYQKDTHILTITITKMDASVVVLLTLA